MVSIHTMQFNIQCHPKVFYTLFETVKQHNQNLHKKVYQYQQKHKSKYSYQCYWESGITRFEFIIKNINEIKQPFITLIINPKILLGDKRLCFSTIVEPQRLNEIKQSLINFLISIYPNIVIETLKIKIARIDYCVNLWFVNQKTADDYMQLLNRFRLKKRETQKLYYHKKRHRNEARDGELTICGASYEFSIYEKHVQLERYREIANEVDSEEDYINSQGQIRIEYRAKRPSIYRYKIREGITDDFDLLYDKFHFPNSVMTNELYSLYGKGDFYKKNEALLIIRNSNYSERVQNRMIKIIKKVSKAKSLDPNLNGIDEKKLSRYINQYFNQIGLSPIVIPKRWNQSYFPNPAKYIEGTSSYLLRDSAEAPVMATEPDIERGLQRNNEAPEP